MIDFNQDGFFLIAGPCVVESKELIFQVGKSLKEWTEELEIPFVFKSSYKKANRSRIDSFTGIGDEKALEALGELRSEERRVGKEGRDRWGDGQREGNGKRMKYMKT